jgi:hypothetical protein
MIIRLSKILKEDIQIKLVDDTKHLSQKKIMELKAISLFHKIDSFGHITDVTWFTGLTREMCIKYIKELYDIWNYRAQLSPLVMREIVPPSGNPFMGLQLHLAQNQGEDYLRRTSLKIMELMVKSGYSQDNKALGAYYVLAALTLVSQDAREALPWLYQSVSYNNN